MRCVPRPRCHAPRRRSARCRITARQVRHNIEAMIGYCGGEVDRWRPHCKTTKMPAVWRMLSAAGVRNFKARRTAACRVRAVGRPEVALKGPALPAFRLHLPAGRTPSSAEPSPDITHCDA